MGKPTESELKSALEEAARMREQGEDPHFIAKALLNLNYRMKYLENVLHAAELYNHSGQSAIEHQRLLAAIKAYHDSDERTAGEEEENLLL